MINLTQSMTVQLKPTFALSAEIHRITFSCDLSKHHIFPRPQGRNVSGVDSLIFRAAGTDDFFFHDDPGHERNYSVVTVNESSALACLIYRTKRADLLTNAVPRISRWDLPYRIRSPVNF